MSPQSYELSVTDLRPFHSGERRTPPPRPPTLLSLVRCSTRFGPFWNASLRFLLVAIRLPGRSVATQPVPADSDETERWERMGWRERRIGGWLLIYGSGK